MMVRAGGDRYPAGWLERYYQAVAWLSRLARLAGARSVLYVVPDIPYDPVRSSRLAGWWMESFHPGLLGHAVPVVVLHPACRDRPGCYREGLEHYRRLLGDHAYDSVYALVQLDRQQPGLSARAITYAAGLARGYAGTYTRIHLLGATLRLAKQLSVSCIPGLASADTSSWYWDRHYGRDRSPEGYLAEVGRLLSQAAGCSRGLRPLTRWLQAQSHTV
ncbi:MAG: hypothetical protein GSR78_00395 [Desulfurococcales archaeon]|nr:hypothetical protein [Desulfurococcales archaeon]